MKRAALAVEVLLAVLAVFVVVRMIGARNDLVRAHSLIQQGNDALLHGSSGTADRDFRAAGTALHRARSATGFPAAVVAPVPLLGSPVRAVRDAVTAGDDIIAGSNVLADAVAGFPIHGSAALHGSDLGPFHGAAARAETALARARPYFDAARARLDGPAGALIPWISEPARSMRTIVDGGIRRVGTAAHAFDVVRQLTSSSADLRILFVGLDTLEARPGGGYIGTFGVLHFDRGAVTLERYQSLETLHAATPPLPAPAGLDAATAAPWGIENSLWWPSFPYSARAAATLYARQGGVHVDGVIGMTNAALGELIGTVGPLHVAGYAPVTGDHFENRVLYETALKRPLDTPRKKFLVATSRALFDALLHLPARLVPRVIDVMNHQVGAGDIRLWFQRADLQRHIAATAVSGTLPDTRGDIVAIAEANVSASKANESVSRVVRYEVHRTDGNAYRAQLTIAYRDDGDANPYLNPYYNAYVRVYVPRVAQLDVATARGFSDVGIAPDAPYRVFAGYVLVQPHGRATIRLDWTLPGSIAPGGHYRLSWLWQAGSTGDTATLVVGDHHVMLTGAQRDHEIAFDMRRNPLAQWMHDRWIFRQVGL